MLPKIVLICILSVILFRFNINCDDCGNTKNYYSPEVMYAFTIKGYIVFYANLAHKTSSEPKIVKTYRVYHTIKNNLTDPHNGLFYELNRWKDIEYLTNDNQIHGFFFTTTGMKPIFPKQTSSPVYLVTLDQNKRDNKGSHVRAMAFDTELKPEKLGSDPSFNKLGEKIVFNFSEPEFDDTEETNIKLLFAHFPQNVYIKGLVILERSLGDSGSMFYSLVYTQEELPDGKHFRVRHYLKGLRKEYDSSLGRKFSRIIWEFDYNYRDKEASNNVCTEMSDSISAVTVVHTEQLNGTLSIFHLIEFYGTKHRYLLLSVAKNGTLSLSENNTLIDNEVFMNCAIRPLPVVVVSDCRKNPLFESQKYETLDEVEANQYFESENWNQIWFVLAIIVMIIAIIALISYGVYSLVSVNKQNSNQ